MGPHENIPKSAEVLEEELRREQAKKLYDQAAEESGRHQFEAERQLWSLLHNARQGGYEDGMRAARGIALAIIICGVFWAVLVAALIVWTPL